MLNENGDKINKNTDILSEIASVVKARIEKQKSEVSLEEIKKKAESMPKLDFSFEKAITKSDMAFICEVKKASPSKGLIAPHFPYLEIAKEYQDAGGTAISCLTEEMYFQGSDKYLEEIAQSVDIPVLRKDFFVDEYMIYQARILGASAVLLICSILTRAQLEKFYKIATSLGLSAIFEAHTKEEVELSAMLGAKIIGVNNRNLKNFTLDIQNSINLKQFAPDDVIFISESGIKSGEDIKILKDAGIKAVLIGETFMRVQDKRAEMAKLKEKL